MNEPLATAPKAGKKKIWLRATAILLALLLPAVMLLNQAASIRFTSEAFAGTLLEQAAAVTQSGTSYLEQGELDRMWRLLKNAVGEPRTYEEYDTFASVAIARTDYEKAIGYMQGCIDTYEGDDAGLATLELKMGSLYALTGKTNDAVAHFNTVEALAPQLADTYLLRAQMEYELGQNDRTLRDMERYLSLAGEQPAVMAAIAPLYEEAGAYEQAVACYTAAIDRPALYETEQLASRARCYLLLGDLPAAQADLLRYMEEGGADPQGSASAMLGVCHMEAKEYPEALAAFHKAVDAGYPRPSLLYAQAVLCGYVTGDYESVIADGKRALAVQEATANDASLTGAVTIGEGELHQWIALSQLALQRYGEALESFQSAKEKNHALPDLDYYSGVCNAALEQYKPAVDCFGASIAKNETVSLSLYNRALCLLQLERYEEGLNDLVAVLQRNDDATAVQAANALLAQLVQPQEPAASPAN